MSPEQRMRDQVEEGRDLPPHCVVAAEDMLNPPWMVRRDILVKIYLDRYFEENPAHTYKRNSSTEMSRLRTFIYLWLLEKKLLPLPFQG